VNSFVQAIIAGFMIFSIGLIHGANDLKLIQNKTQKKSQKIFFQTLLLYIFVVLAGVFLFYFLPSFGLFFFVAFSAFHFGEQHLESKVEIDRSPAFKWILYISYGCALFGLLFTLQWETVHAVIGQISGQYISKQTTELLFFTGFIVFLLVGLFSPSLRKLLFFETLILFLLGLLFVRTTLIFGFGFYFVVWHSIPSVKDQLNFLYPSDNQAALKYLKSSLPYWVMSIFGLVGVYFLFDVQSAAFLPLFFSFLGAITFPHTVVMGWLKLSEQKTNGQTEQH
jgi:Brp/Blh family beta-carotene 15,15'-monooxygenase